MTFKPGERILLLTGAVAAAALALITPAKALGDETARLHATPQVVGEVIVLGDVLAIDGPAADAILARSPAPGRRLALEPDHVAAVAQRNGVTWRNAGQVHRVTVERLGEAIAPDAMETAIAAWLADQDGGQWTVDLNSDAPIYIGYGETPAVQVRTLEREANAETFDATLTLSADGAPVRVRGRASQTRETPVLARPIARDAVITIDDLVWVDLPPRGANRDAVTDPSAIIGMAARRSLRAGDPLRALDLVRPPAIHRGESVMVIYELGALRLTARGRALADAAVGEAARVVNTDSNRTIEAVVVGPGLVSVSQGA